MSMNNNNPVKNVGVPISFVNPGVTPQSVHTSHRSPQLLAHSQAQTQGGRHLSGHFELSGPQSQSLTQAHYAQSHAQAQAHTAYAQFQAQVQAQAQVPNPGSNSVAVSSPSILTPGLGSAKRAPQKPPSRPSGASGGGTASPLKTMELTPAILRRKRKLPENQIPDKVAAIVPESTLYSQLLEFEAHVDAALTRKKIDIQESLKNPPRFQKTLRIYVFNTFSNQMQQNPEKKTAELPSWSLKIIGRILEGGIDPYAAGSTQSLNSSLPKFSSFIKKITIYLDHSLYPENHVILWESSRSPALNEGFEVRRKGDKEFTAIIRLEMNYVPEKFKLSQALAEVLGLEVETRARVIAALWHYVKVRKLQIASDPSFFMCDLPLRKVFGEEKMKFSMVSQKISQHLTPPQPIHLEHRVKLSGNNPVGHTCYDILVDVPFSLEKEMAAFLAKLEKHKEVDACDESICASIKKIHEHRRRRAFFLGFSQSPAEFINTLIASQGRDLKLAVGEATRNIEQEHRADFYSQTWAEDAVIRYLNRKAASGSDAPRST